MSQIISTPNSEFNSAGRRKNESLLGGINSEPIPNLRAFAERDTNRSLRQVEKELLEDIKNLLSKTELKLSKISFHHVSPQLKTCLRAAKFNEVNGVGFVVFEFENHKNLFAHSICDLRDTYSRLEGRVYSLRRAWSQLRKNLTVAENLGLDSIPVPEGVQKEYSSDTPYKIANYIIKKYIRRPEKEDVGESPLKFINEDELRISVSSQLSDKFNLDPNSLQYYSVALRKYGNKYYEGMNCTSQWFKDLQDPDKEINPRGGHVIMGIVGIDKDTQEKSVFVTLSACSPEDNFNRHFGRRQCLVNFTKQRFDIYSLSQELNENMSDALVKLAARYRLVVNVEIKAELPQGIVAQ